MSTRPKLIKDPLHGYIELDEYERGIVDSAVFQRLRRISQLPFADLVYPGARHTRFDHSLGSFHLAGQMTTQLGLEEHRAKVVKYAALLHDVGHPPFSHLLEPLLFERQTNHERIGIKIIQEDEQLASAIESSGVQTRDVTDILDRKTPESAIVVGPVDCDKLDFLLRDSYFSGVTYGHVDTKRLIKTMRMVDDKIAIHTRGLGVVEEFAIARLQSFLNIYFHHAVRAAQILFLSSVSEVGNDLDLAKMDVKEYLGQDDLTLWCALRSHKKASRFIHRITTRDLPKLAFEIRPTGEKISLSMLGKDDMKTQIVEHIAEDASLSSDKIWIDSPFIAPLPLSLPSEVPFYSDDGGNFKTVQIYSPLLDALSPVFNILRIYTEKEYRSRVHEAAKKFFEPFPEVTRVSY